MRLFYKEAKQLVNRTFQDEEEISIIEIKRERKLDHDLQVIRLQRALRRVYEEGYHDGVKSHAKGTT